MKNILKNISYTFIGCMLILSACTKLDENLYNQVVAENFYKNKQEVTSAVVRPYTHARAWAAINDRHGYWRLQELPGDQQAWPQKGRHGYDGGQWVRQHYHEWTLTDRAIEEPWELMYWGIGFCNNLMEELEPVDFVKIGMTEAEKAAIMAEAKVLRAWHYLKLMDLYGNIPIVTEVGKPANPPTKPRKEVFEFIEKELKENVDLLPNLTASLQGRVNKAAGYAMLVELYLNAQVWTGTQRWDDCIAACDKIISGQTGGLNGAVELDANLLTPFNITNHLSKENLFQLSYDYVKSGDAPGYNGLFWHYRQRQIYNTERDGNNAFVVTPNGFDAFKEIDLRKKEWFLFGPQFKFGTTDPVLGTEEYNGKPLVFVNNIRRNSEGETGPGGMTKGEENSGARMNKYRPGQLTDANYLGNDFVVYRLSEIIYNKAEALMRKNNGVATQPAVDLVNSVRKRAFTPADFATEAYTTATLTSDEFLAERGREFVFEGKRRSDMIRFGKFATADWWDHKAKNNANLNVFPIPTKQLVINPSLVQNPGY
ncbi:MAG TPA: RagB/SusD family nutrient uptake outer membrane protein [Flavitalea sp.]|nr:RagB/SusD family nutrient uptake outer membrane protein [Flavitalea sp.]